MKRFDKGYFYYKLIASLAIAAFVVLMVLESVGETLVSRPDVLVTVCVAVFAAVYIVSAVYAFAYVKTSGYELNENEIKCRRGVLFRKSSALEYSRVHAINKKQNLIQRIFKISVLTVDSGATSNSFSAEIIIIEKTETVDSLMREIKLRQKGNYEASIEAEAYSVADVNSDDNLYEFSSKLKWIYSALSVIGAVIVIFILGILAFLTIAIIKPFLQLDAETPFISIVVSAALIFVATLVMVTIFSLIGSVIASFVGFYDFKIVRREDDIEISYGLLVRNTNTFKFNKIKAVKIVQGPIRRMFGFASANLEVVGYSSGTNENQSDQQRSIGVLFPIFKLSMLNETLSKILPAYIPIERQHRSNSFFSFVLWRYFAVMTFGVGALGLASILLSALSAPSIVWGYVVTALVIVILIALIIVTVSGALQYKNSGIAIEGDRLTLYNGGLVLGTSVILKKNIIAVQDITTPMRAKKGIYTYILHFYTNSTTNTVTVRCLEGSLAEQLRDFMTY